MENTMDKYEYIKENIVWGLITFFLCRTLFFRCIPKCTYKESLLLLLLIAILVMGLGIFVTLRWSRNLRNVCGNIIMTWGVYVVCAYRDLFKQKIIVLSLVAGVVSLLLTLLVLGRKVKRPDKKRIIMKRRVRNIIGLWRRNLTFASLFLLVPMTISVVLHGTVLNSNVKVEKVYGDEYRLDVNIDEIAYISPEHWCNLKAMERLNICQKIVNCQGRYLGLSHEVTVGTAELSKNTVAYYSEPKHQIVIDMDRLMGASGYTILESILHECEHVYQTDQVTLYRTIDPKYRDSLLFYDASIYTKEFADYVDGNNEDDILEYYGQKCEYDARNAAAEQSLEYISRINDYWEKKDDA